MTIPVVDAQPYADAIKAALTAQSIAHAEGKKPANVAADHPYIVWWLDPGTITDRTLRSRDGLLLRLVVQHYGLTTDAVRVAVRKGRAAVASLAGAAVAGRVLLVPSHSPAEQMQRDDDVNPPLWWQTDVWSLPTSPA